MKKEKEYIVTIITKKYKQEVQVKAKNKKEAEHFVCFLSVGCVSVQHLHDFSAAAGNYIAGLHMQQLVADGAVDITFFFRPHHAVQASLQFIFHSYR